MYQLLIVKFWQNRFDLSNALLINIWNFVSVIETLEFEWIILQTKLISF